MQVNKIVVSLALGLLAAPAALAQSGSECGSTPSQGCSSKKAETVVVSEQACETQKSCTGKEKAVEVAVTKEKSEVTCPLEALAGKLKQKQCGEQKSCGQKAAVEVSLTAPEGDECGMTCGSAPAAIASCGEEKSCAAVQVKAAPCGEQKSCAGMQVKAAPCAEAQSCAAVQVKAAPCCEEESCAGTQVKKAPCAGQEACVEVQVIKASDAPQGSCCPAEGKGAAGATTPQRKIVMVKNDGGVITRTVQVIGMDDVGSCASGSSCASKAGSCSVRTLVLGTDLPGCGTGSSCDDCPSKGSCDAMGSCGTKASCGTGSSCDDCPSKGSCGTKASCGSAASCGTAKATHHGLVIGRAHGAGGHIGLKPACDPAKCCCCDDKAGCDPAKSCCCGGQEPGCVPAKGKCSSQKSCTIAGGGLGGIHSFGKMEHGTGQIRIVTRVGGEEDVRFLSLPQGQIATGGKGKALFVMGGEGDDEPHTFTWASPDVGGGEGGLIMLGGVEGADCIQLGGDEGGEIRVECEVIGVGGGAGGAFGGRIVECEEIEECCPEAAEPRRVQLFHSSGDDDEDEGEDHVDFFRSRYVPAAPTFVEHGEAAAELHAAVRELRAEVKELRATLAQLRAEIRKARR